MESMAQHYGRDSSSNHCPDEKGTESNMAKEGSLSQA